MSRNKVFRLSATRLLAPDDLVAVCIPYWFRDVLLDTTERYLWSRVWRDGDDPHELTEQEISRIEYAIYRLTLDDFCWEEFMPPITVTVNPIVNVTTGGDGCCGTSPQPWEPIPQPGGTPNYPIPITNPPVPNVPPTIPPDTDPSEWDILRCKAANYAWEQIRVWLVAISNIPANLIAIGMILSIIWAMAPLGLLALIGGAVLELAAVIWSWYAISEGLDEISEFAVEWWDDHQELLVCEFYEMTDNTATRAVIVSGFLDDLAVWAETRPWWVDSLGDMLASLGGKLFPLQIFTAPWQLVPPVGYVGAITCPCEPSENEEWQEHPTYIWIPLTNALLDEFTATPIEPGQQNIYSHVLTDDGRISWSFSDSTRMDMLWKVIHADVVASVTGGVRVAGIGWDFYDSNPPFSSGGSPYWYETMPDAALDVTVTDTYPKKWWVYLNNAGDSDVNATLVGIADYNENSSIMGTNIQSFGEVQSSPTRARNGSCRVRFLVKVSS